MCAFTPLASHNTSTLPQTSLRRKRWGLWCLSFLACLQLSFFLHDRWDHRVSAVETLYQRNMGAPLPHATLPPPMSGARIVIFAPHEDDETLGAAGYIQQAVAAGAHVRVVLVTNGDRVLRPVLGPDGSPRMRMVTAPWMGRHRQAETRAAMQSLGVPASAVTFLGYPTGRALFLMSQPGGWLPASPVSTTGIHYANAMTPHAVWCGQSMLQDVETVLRQEQPQVIIVPHPNDLHFAHWPVYLYVQLALAELTSQHERFAESCQLLTYLVHRGDDSWPAPQGYQPSLSLCPPASLEKDGETDWRALPLTPAQIAGKRTAINKYVTQGAQANTLLASFVRTNEVFGLRQLGAWPALSTVPMTPILRDPSADTKHSVTNPEADITLLSLSREGDRMSACLTLNAIPSTRFTYHFALYGVGSAITARCIAQYDIRGHVVSGTVLDQGTVHPLPTASLRRHITGTTLTLTAPWPLVDDRQTTFLLYAWSSRGTYVADRTAPAILVIAPPAQGIRVTATK